MLIPHYPIQRCLIALLAGSGLLCAQTLTDPVTELSRKIAQGKTDLAFDSVYGYLPAVLKALNIPVESQMAVFSKTSVQGIRIEPSNPRNARLVE